MINLIVTTEDIASRLSADAQCELDNYSMEEADEELAGTYGSLDELDNVICHELGHMVRKSRRNVRANDRENADMIRERGYR